MEGLSVAASVRKGWRQRRQVKQFAVGRKFVADEPKDHDVRLSKHATFVTLLSRGFDETASDIVGCGMGSHVARSSGMVRCVSPSVFSRQAGCGMPGREVFRCVKNLETW